MFNEEEYYKWFKNSQNEWAIKQWKRWQTTKYPARFLGRAWALTIQGDLEKLDTLETEFIKGLLHDLLEQLPGSPRLCG